MNILGIDFGLKKVGLAMAVSPIAMPYMVLRSDFINRISMICNKEHIDKIVIGVSEGKMAEESKKFGRELKEKTNLPVEFSDETLTSQDAQRLSIEAGIGRKRRKSMEDAYSATLMLQNYIDQVKI